MKISKTVDAEMAFRTPPVRLADPPKTGKTSVLKILTHKPFGVYAYFYPIRYGYSYPFLAENTRSRTVERPIETAETRETPVERPPKHHNWKRILGTAAIIGVSVAAGAAGGACTPSRDVIRSGPR